MLVYVYRIAAYVSVVAVRIVGVVAVIRTVVVVVAVVVIRIVIVVVIVVVVVVVVPVAAVVAAVVVTAVPSWIPVVRSSVINDWRSMPSATPAAVTPSAASTSHHRPDCNPRSEPDHSGGHDAPSAVRIRNDIRCPVDNCGIVGRDVDDLRIGRLNYDYVGGLLHHGYLGRCLQVAGGFCFCT